MVAPGRPPLGGRYELERRLAMGGMGEVWRGRDLLLGRAVAVKVLRSEYAGDRTFRARFRAEAQHAALLAHRNIAAVHDYGEVPADQCGEHLAYLVMELVDGEPLSAVLAREGRLDVPRTLDVLGQTAAGLAAAHAAGVVHRDVKPGNILVGTDGVVRITDFGVAWSASNVPLTQTGQVVGTAQYLSPEQADGGKGGPASDVYALGMIGYECLAGHRAFDGGTPVQIALRQIREEPAPLPADVPEAVRTLIGRALRKDPAERFPDGAAFGAAVEEVRAGRSLPPLPPAPGTLTFPAGTAISRRARRLMAPLVALVAGAALGIGALEFLVASPPAEPVTAHSAPATGLVLRSEEYVGRPVAEVAADLVALGLQVARVPQETGDAAPGTVLALDPIGAVRPGERVTVTYAVAPPAPAAPAPVQAASGASTPSAPGGEGQGRGDGAAESRGHGKDENDKNKDKGPGRGHGNGRGD